MEYIEKIKKMLCKELDEYAMKQKLTGGDLDMIWKLTDTVKNLDKIEMLEDEGGYSEARGGRGSSYVHGSSYDDDIMYSERRGRGSNAKRDSMGRYANDNEYAEDGSSYGYIPNYGYTRDRYPNERYMRDGYSRDEHEGKEMMMSQLKEMMNQAESSKEREAIQRCISSIKNA